MKSIISLVLMLFLCKVLYSQDISGLWRSEDGTRVYEVRNDNGIHSAILLSSTRADDKTGVDILRDVTYKKKKGIFEGAIISADEDPVAAFTRIIPKGEQLHFKIRRLFFNSVSIRWVRVR